ncbi:tetratricopeptide repeat protein [Pleionea sp. CnH1-48]|uniref:tetratricopeptide repeat protein n=1 Tax=Pleionea sp. CnH1-48 TaxID=2954494 RepID=UPI0020969AF3|nr:hypothetical protein [Pleionea sp. CnH1-48]MCO7223751.1 hypothetical protein [Pleionea sp. CnH1-48]
MLGFALLGLVLAQSAFANGAESAYQKALKEFSGKRDFSKIEKWLIQAASEEHRKAQSALAFYYTYRSSNEKKALSYHYKAADNECMESSYWLAHRALQNNQPSEFYRRFKQGLTRATSCYEVHSHAFPVSIVSKMHRMVEEMYGVIDKAAQEPNPRDQFLLGVIYFQGYKAQGIPDFKTGVLWLEKAAQQNHVLAQFTLASVYTTDITGTENRALARHWIKEAYQRRNHDSLTEEEKQKIIKLYQCIHSKTEC